VTEQTTIHRFLPLSVYALLYITSNDATVKRDLAFPNPDIWPQRLGKDCHKPLCYSLWVYCSFSRVVTNRGLIGSKRRIKLYTAAAFRAIMNRANYSFIGEANICAACNKTRCNEINNSLYSYMCAATAQSVQRLATGWTGRRSNPGGGEIFRTRPDRSWGPTQPSIQWIPRLSRG